MTEFPKKCMLGMSIIQFISLAVLAFLVFVWFEFI